MRAGMSVHGGCGRSPYVNWEIKNERMKRYIFCISLCLGVVSGGRAAAQEPPAEPEAALPLLEVKMRFIGLPRPSMQVLRWG